MSFPNLAKDISKDLAAERTKKGIGELTLVSDLRELISKRVREKPGFLISITDIELEDTTEISCDSIIAKLSNVGAREAKVSAMVKVNKAIIFTKIEILVAITSDLSPFNSDY